MTGAPGEAVELPPPPLEEVLGDRARREVLRRLCDPALEVAAGREDPPAPYRSAAEMFASFTAPRVPRPGHLGRTWARRRWLLDLAVGVGGDRVERLGLLAEGETDSGTGGGAFVVRVGLAVPGEPGPRALAVTSLDEPGGVSVDDALEVLHVLTVSLAEVASRAADDEARALLAKGRSVEW